MILPAGFNDIKEQIEQIAIEHGLDFFPVEFSTVDFDQMNELAAFDGFPVRFPHWQFAMRYEQLRKSSVYGLHRIYEMVLNTNPCIAYLLQGNSLTDQKLVMAHVFAHADFFKNNLYFSHTDRKMLDKLANHASRIRRFGERHGTEVVEKFLDQCLSLQNLIDPDWPFRMKKNGSLSGTVLTAPKGTQFPEKPEQDVLGFLLEHAPLRDWQEAVLSMIRDESYYFVPQTQTRILNEGWATYWHSKMMTERIASDGEIIDYATAHAGALAPHAGNLNPYKLGCELLRDIESRWDAKAFRQTSGSGDSSVKNGRQKIFEVRQLCNDLSFIDNYLTEDFCARHQLFTFEFNAVDQQFEVAERSFRSVKNKLLQSLTNLGSPEIYVLDGNYHGQGALYLQHAHDGNDLKMDEARATLVNLFEIWQKNVCLETVYNESRMVLSFDGSDFNEQKLH